MAAVSLFVESPATTKPGQACESECSDYVHEIQSPVKLGAAWCAARSGPDDGAETRARLAKEMAKQGMAAQFCKRSHSHDGSVWE